MLSDDLARRVRVLAHGTREQSGHAPRAKSQARGEGYSSSRRARVLPARLHCPRARAALGALPLPAGDPPCGESACSTRLSIELFTFCSPSDPPRLSRRSWTTPRTRTPMGRSAKTYKKPVRVPLLRAPPPPPPPPLAPACCVPRGGPPPALPPGERRVLTRARHVPSAPRRQRPRPLAHPCRRPSQSRRLSPRCRHRPRPRPSLPHHPSPRTKRPTPLRSPRASAPPAKRAWTTSPSGKASRESAGSGERSDRALAQRTHLPLGSYNLTSRSSEPLFA